MGVSTVQIIGKSLVPGAVVGQGRIQEIYMYVMVRDAMQGVAPGLNLYLPPLNGNRYPRLHELQVFFRSPVNRGLGLVAQFIKMLSETALTIQKCHAYHGYAHVGGGSQSVSSHHPETPTVSG